MNSPKALGAMVFAFGAALAAAPPARGDVPEHPAVLPEDPSRPPGEKRPPQDYEGRPRETTAAEGALWIPRVLFAPLYVVSDYVIRRPLGAITTVIDREGIVAKVTDFFTFGPHHNVGLIPTAFYEFGFRPSVGLYHFYDDFLVTDNQLRASVATGGERYFAARVVDRVPLDVEVEPDGSHRVRSNLQLEADGVVRADYLFYGVGYRSRYADESRFEQRSVGGGIRTHVEPRKANFVEAWAVVRHHSFSDESCPVWPHECPTLPISRAVARGLYPLPDGFAGYTAVKVGGRVVLDSRQPRPGPGSGVGLDAHAELGSDVGSHVEWAQVGGSVGGFIDVTGTRRVLGLLVDVRAIEPFSSTARVPFTELIGSGRTDRVPDDEPLLGFTPGRLLGETSAAASVTYTWPIWSFVDATLRAQVGNVFGRDFEDFELERLRFSFVGGFQSPNHRDHALNLLLGFGTKPFAEGGEPESVRFLVGGTTGF
ncbi:MAG: hypothetical protein U0414_27325 [Polyangiaceae bacterium]